MKIGDTGKKMEPMPTELQHAVCAFVESIGIQKGSYGGKDIYREQIIICWELAETMTQGDNAGKPFMISKFYTASLSKKSNLSKDLQAWLKKEFTQQERDEGFEMDTLIGTNCMLNIGEKVKPDGDVRYQVVSIAPKMKQLPNLDVHNKKCPEWINDMKKRAVPEDKVPKEGEEAVVDIHADENLPF